MTYAILISLGICVISALLEGLFAGKGVKQYLAKLRVPSYSPPLWVWSIIAVFYYAMCFFILYRILRHDADVTIRNVALALILLLMIINAFWNYLFFRAKNLFLSLVAALPYFIIAVALFVCLLQFDKNAAWPLVAYFVYSVYAVRWGYWLWKLND